MLSPSWRGAFSLDDLHCCQEDFEEHAALAKTLKDCTNDNLLILYGLYKATVGPVNTSCPGIFNMRERAKWNAWKAVEGIYEEFANALVKAVQSMQVGNGLLEGISQGPLINEAAVQKVEKFVNDATSKGANVILGGKRHSLGMTFYEPTVVSNVNRDMLLFKYIISIFMSLVRM